MENQVEEVKQKTNIVNVVGETVTLKKKGRNWVGLCPFHGEKTASFMVNEELQIYKCFGCGAGGDVFKFVELTEGLDFGEALEKLAEKAGVKLIKQKGEDGNGKRALLEVHNLAAEYYHYLLTKHRAGEVARKYLEGRDIGEKLSETFKLGYALPEWDGLVSYLCDKKGYPAEVLVAAGLATGGSRGIYDRFRGRIMFPLYDVAGRVVGFAGRVLPGAKEDEAKYINSPETEIYHKSRMLYGLTVARGEIKKKNRAVVVEGELDMISSFAAGVTETVAIKGSALTEEMLTTLSRLSNNLVLALDADAAGEAAMKRSIQAAERLELGIKMVEMTGGKDPDEIARKKPREWGEMVEKAVPIYEFFFNKAIGRYGTETAEAVGKVVKEVVPYLAKVENNVVREVWAKKLAERVGVDKQRVWEELEKNRSGAGAPVVKVRVAGEVDHDILLDLQMVGMLLAVNQETRERIEKLLVGLPLNGAVGKLIGVIFENKEVKKAEELIRSLPSELSALAGEAYLAIDEVGAEKEVMKLATSWARRVIRDERRVLAEAIKKEEEGENGSEMGNLSEKLVKLNALERKLVTN